MNGLRSLIAEDPERARIMTTQIANLMRYALQAGQRDRVRLADELEAVRDYLGIEGARLEARLAWTIAADAADPAALLPPMLLQTLVENAIKHGVAATREGGAVRIEARTPADALELVVENPGRLAAVPGEGHGLALVRERLRLLYGDAGSLVLREDAGRVLAEVRIPLERAS